MSGVLQDRSQLFCTMASMGTWIEFTMHVPRYQELLRERRRSRRSILKSRLVHSDRFPAVLLQFRGLVGFVSIRHVNPGSLICNSIPYRGGEVHVEFFISSQTILLPFFVFDQLL